MDSLFGVQISSIMVTLLALLAAVFAVLGVIAWRNPLLVRMGLRNVTRRAAQTTLIVVGLMLSTLIISAALATGDTVGASITNQLYAQLEEVDFVVVFDPDRAPVGTRQHLVDADLTAVRAALADDPDIDGITALTINTTPVLNLEQRLSEPDATFVGLDPETADSFRGLRALNGDLLAADALRDNLTYITVRLAEAIDAGKGDTVTVFIDDEPHPFQVLDVVRDTALTSAGTDEGVPSGGMAVHIDTARTLLGTEGEIDVIVVSITGGTRDTLDKSDAVEEKLESFLDTSSVPAEIDITKKELVTIGELFGSFFVAFFLIMGLFSISSGVLLIVLIFIMLAAERRSEMGIARAVGMNRLHLTESFLAEGMAYNLGSAAVGALLGLGVAFGLIWVMARIFDDFGLNIVFHFNIQGFVIAYCLGVVLTFATVAFSSWRAANLNIVRAIRDLPEPQPLSEANPSLPNLLRATAGALWYVAWIAIIVLFVVMGGALFYLTLGSYGIGLLPAGLLAAWFIFGARRAARIGLPRRAPRTVRRVLFWVIPIVPLALAIWHLLRGQRTDGRANASAAAYQWWWIIFNVVAVITALLLRSKGWADRHRGGGGWAVVMSVLGAILIYFGGWVWNQQFAYAGGTTLFLLGAAMLAVYFGAATHRAFTVAGLALLWYWLLSLPFSLFSEAGKGLNDPLDGLLRVIGLDPDPGDGNIEMIFVSGISLTASATLVVIFNAERLLGVVSSLGRWMGGAAPAIRTAVAYPLAAKFRTAMTLSMFALVVFSLVVMSFLNFNFSQLFTSDDATGGFDVVVDVNSNNRIADLREALASEGYDVDANIAGVGVLVSAFPDFATPGSDVEPRSYRLQGMDEQFLALTNFRFQFRAKGYDSDAAVLEALRNDPRVAVVDASRFPISGPFGSLDEGLFLLPVSEAELDAAPWDPLLLTVRNRDTGTTFPLRIIATLQPQATAALTQFFAIFTNIENIERHFDGGELEDYFVTTVSGSDEAAETVAKGIESTLLERGVEADSIRRIIDDQAALSLAFQLLFEGFMALGLVVGVAALGVIAFRTVVERRQQIGMLRAIGYSRRLVSLSFFLESSFIALTGIVMGVGLGWALSYNLLSNPENIGAAGTEIDFAVPWVRLALIASVAYGASALMTLIPVRSASRVPVAEALRYE